MNSPGTISALGQVAITVKDVAKCKDFYANVLGLKPLFDAGRNLSFLAAGSVRLMLTAPEDAGEPGGNSVLYYKTDSVEASYNSIVAKGGQGVHGPQMVAKLPDHTLWLAFVRDPEGNLVGLMEERR